MAGRSKDIKITANIRQNKLLLQLSGRITKKDLDTLYTDVRFCVADLKPGFDIITDLSGCKLANLTGLPTFVKIMNFLIDSKVGEIVRITRHNSIIHRQILNFTASRQGYRPIYVSTLEEAEAVLAKSDRNNLPRLHFLHLPVRYSVNGLEGSGHIHQLTMGSCRVGTVELMPSINDTIEMTLAFKQREAAVKTFELTAAITGVEEDVFIAEFVDFEEERKNQFWKCIAFEAQRDPANFRRL